MSDVEKIVYFAKDKFEKLAAAEDRNWWFRSRNRILIWALECKVGRFRSFLEIGCGTGFVLESIRKAFPGIELCGSEYFEEGLIFARERVPTATFSQVDATTMDDLERFDAIGAFDVLEHIEEDQKVLNNLARALKHGGAVVITVPQHSWLWSSVDQAACHVRRYDRAELIRKVSAAGISVEYISSFVSLLLPLMWVVRLKARSGMYDPMSEFRIPNLLNSALESVMRFEIRLIRWGCRFPAGGSLLLVGRKP